MTAELWAEVAIPVPLRRLFTYRLPPALTGRVEPGHRVAVPFGPRKLTAIVAVVRAPGPEEPRPPRLRDVAALLEGEPVFSPELLRFLVEAADYYCAAPGEVMRAAAPAVERGQLRALHAAGFLEDGESIKTKTVASRTVTMVRPLGRDRSPGTKLGRLGAKQRTVLDMIETRGEVSVEEIRGVVADARAVVRSLADRGLVVTETREAPADRFFAHPVSPDVPPELAPAQARAVARLVEAIGAGGYHPFLLHGVTGSGKTEVYLRAVREARARGRGVLVLVPEIGLTPQLVARFRARFGDALAVLHSGLRDRERHAFWRALRAGELRIAIGARSAVFAPLRDLGLVVVDEEHDASFKQEEGFRYHGRDMAMLRAARAGAVCVLGSATPSLESYHLSEAGKLERLELPERVGTHPLPSVEIIDLARHGPGPIPERHPLLTGPLVNALARCLDAGDQAILFLNRRGFAPSMRCPSCRENVCCRECSVALVLHRRAQLLRCHYCDFSMAVTDVCPSCRRPGLEALGLGTERLEDAIRSAFPRARVGRLDRDVATGAGAETVLEKLREREIDVLVGTQMVTKGHDIPGVTLVAILCADQSLAFPDFRAEERTFQLLAQVAGRAGRGERAGRVLLQTFQPTNRAVLSATRHDYLGFYAQEIDVRRNLAYPPFGRLALVRVDGPDEREARLAAQSLADLLSRRGKADPRLRVRGPAPAPFERLRGRWRFQILVSAAERSVLRTALRPVLERIDEGLGKVRASVDIDPVSML